MTHHLALLAYIATLMLVLLLLLDYRIRPPLRRPTALLLRLLLLLVRPRLTLLTLQLSLRVVQHHRGTTATASHNPSNHRRAGGRLRRR